MDQDKLQTDGRKANAAQPLGDRKGLMPEREARKAVDAARKSAGPDGPDAGEVGRSFKGKR